MRALSRKLRKPSLPSKTSSRFLSSSSVFPSLTIRANELIPQGSFAQLQADYLSPHVEETTQLDALLKKKNVGVVAHFYMDPELQGVLTGVSWPHVHIADSLVMGEHALKMVKSGVDSILCLGVDFMTENVQATINAEGFSTPVYRLADRFIGCSLAEAAEGPQYAAWLQKASAVPNSVHIVYINTSLRTKANAHALVPTITCTSGNVVQTVLQASAQVPDLHIWFGPDTYMGENLVRTFRYMADQLTDAQIRDIHPQHSRATLTAMLERFHYFQQGNCVVHHMFGGHVTDTVRQHYLHAFQTAHLEVPGEMFELALAAQQQQKGIVGSTRNILDFILGQVSAAAQSPARQRVSLPFVLGTEAGMITSIVTQVQKLLRELDAQHVDCEIIFPVAEEAMAAEPDSPLGVVPGVSAGEGCSAGGGCATCPYMKMNSLESLFDVLQLIGDEKQALALAKYKTEKYADSAKTTRQGVISINHMRQFTNTGLLGADLVSDVTSRAAQRFA